MAREFLSLLTPANLSTALIAMNFVAFTTFGLDKFQPREFEIEIRAGGGEREPPGS